jgi:ankyrin repeat protein
MSTKQLEWLEKELSQSDSDWKVCFFHHPIYSSGKRHGSDVELRAVLEPLFVKYSVDVVFSGHEHFYERLKPQNGIAYFISGAAGKLRSKNIADSDITVKGFDKDYSFMLIELVEDEMHFQTIARSGQTVDYGSIRHREAEQARNKSGLSDALLAVAAKGDAGHLRNLIDQGADVDVRDMREWSTYGFTALMWAAMEGHPAAVRLLLDSGAEVDAADRQDGATALMRAADSNCVETARLLLERGADVNARDRHGYTVLMGAAEQGHNRMVELLLRHGGEVNARHRIDGTDALMLAADEGHLSTLKILLAAGANAHAGDSDGRTALMRAVEIERADIASVLIEAHADPNQADREGETALQEAIERANPELLHALRKTNIDRRQEHELRDRHDLAR